MDPTIDSKLNKLRSHLTELESLVVCYSGGLDSAFLLAVAREQLGDRVVAVTADSPSLPQDDRRDIITLVDRLNVEHHWVNAGEFSKPAYLANGPDRCYHCKHSIFSSAHRVRERLGFAHVADGAHLDDMGDYRPGNRAATELSLVRPLQDAGFTKDDIRECARHLGLEIWSKPSAACLSSRIPYGTPISERLIRQLDEAESALRSMGFAQVRVRYHVQVARLEVPTDNLMRVLERRKGVIEAVRKAGFTYVTLDLEGYRVGSLNAMLPSAQR